MLWTYISNETNINIYKNNFLIKSFTKHNWEIEICSFIGQLPENESKQSISHFFLMLNSLLKLKYT